MDTLLVPITDILKHHINENYLTYEDKKLNMMLYSLIAIILALFCKYILTFSPRDVFNYFIWHYNYSIMKKETLIFPLCSHKKKIFTI
jgi:hypothetical protein